jgi:hypothetical protein
MGLSKEQLLVEIEDVIRTMPPQPTLRHATTESLEWLGRVSAVLTVWNHGIVIGLSIYIQNFGHRDDDVAESAFRQVMVWLHQARQQLRMEMLAPTNVAVAQGMVFDYFDEIRRSIELAKQDLLFVDPYLDAEFVSRYLPYVAAGVTVRLLARQRLTTLLPAVDTFARQAGIKKEVRSAPHFHDRYIFAEKVSCYQSGASFKDGAKKAPTTLTQITDAFPAVRKTYEDLWSGAHIERA